MSYPLALCEYTVIEREVLICSLDVNRDLITATAAIAGLSSMLFGLITNLPVALA
jgi:AGZA family xanthine/uracil permease-like MFS transporter